MPVEQRESQLTAQALQGDKEAFGDLYEYYLEEVYRYVFYRVSNEADAEDLTEQVFLKVWENLPNFQQRVPFKAWLYRIARNTVIDHYRTRKKNFPINENYRIWLYLIRHPDTENICSPKAIFTGTVISIIPGSRDGKTLLPFLSVNRGAKILRF